MFVMPKAKLCLFVCLLIFVGCANQMAYSVKVKPEEQMRFSGKGAGAGMMLSSTMGAMGIAIGVAIDEGIAKEISETAIQNNIFITSILEDALQNKRDSLSRKYAAFDLTINHYGFSAQAGPNDPTSAQLHIVLNENTKHGLAIRFPQDFVSQDSFLLKTSSLADIKTNPDVIKFLLQDAAMHVVESLINQ